MFFYFFDVVFISKSTSATEYLIPLTGGGGGVSVRMVKRINERPLIKPYVRLLKENCLLSIPLHKHTPITLSFSREWVCECLKQQQQQQQHHQQQGKL